MWRIMILGLVQGFSEFLPISSSGHLIVLRWLFRIASQGAEVEVMLHVGTLLAVIVGYRRDLAEMAKGLIHGDVEARHMVSMIIVATLPAVVTGYLLEMWITQWFFPLAVGAGWLMTTAALWLTPPAESGTKQISDIGWRSALIMGLAQSLALWPGLSRSGTTIFSGRVLGLAPIEAARFSFYMAIPIISGASVLTFASGDRMVLGSLWTLGLGLGVAAISGIFAIKWVKHALATTRLWQQFGWYTLALGLVTLWLGGF